MITTNIARTKAEHELGTSAVRLQRELTLENGATLSIWILDGPMPSPRVAIVEVGGMTICTSHDFQSFEMMLKVVRPNVTNISLLRQLLRDAAPGNLGLIESKNALGWLPKYSDIWQEPQTESGKTTFFCNDFAFGRYLRLTINEQFDLTVEDLGPGKLLARR